MFNNGFRAELNCILYYSSTVYVLDRLSLTDTALTDTGVVWWRCTIYSVWVSVGIQQKIIILEIVWV